LATSPPGNIVGGQGFNTNDADTNRTSGFTFTTSTGTNVVSTSTFNTNDLDTNRTPGQMFTSAVSASNATPGYGFTAVSPGSGQYALRQAFHYYTFQPGMVTNGIYLCTALDASTNVYTLVSNTPIYQDTGTNQINLRDPYICQWSSNGVTWYLLTYTTHYGDWISSGTPGPAVATSLDGTNFTLLGYVPLGTAYHAQWSPKFNLNATNGLVATVGLSASGGGAQPTNAFIYDVNLANLTNWTNPRWLNLAAAGAQRLEPSAGIIIFTNGMYHYFSSAGEEFTNTSLASVSGVSVNWNQADGRNPFGKYLHAGPNVFFYNGLWYWFSTDNGLQYITSPTLPFPVTNNYSVLPSPAGLVSQEGAIFPIGPTPVARF
jgi:hypothetical protein